MSAPNETDAFLLTLDDTGITDVGALLFLQARPSGAKDSELVRKFVESDAPFTSDQPEMLITHLPGVVAQ